MKIQRHQLIFPEHQSPFTIHTCHGNNQAIMQYVAAWISKGLPCIYARQLCQDESMMNLGLPVVIGHTKHRVGLHINKNHITSQQALPKLVTMDQFFSKKIQRQSKQFFTPQELKMFKSVFVYGSFLFEYLSEELFVSDTSDLDLLIEYEHFSLGELNQMITTLKKLFDLPIDGEVRFKNLGDISFTELLSSPADNLLYKTPYKIGLLSRDALFHEYPDLRRRS
jgi:phosphoribosyl-dephospho-CoA transferase